ncbi:MAG: type II toxin-antitoxin system RelE/ParE family toxin [Spirochaetales bacterium]|nr:type II toxin-antitoxin system RelE/ParE family toxin [Spirochaetales bacterium]
MVIWSDRAKNSLRQIYDFIATDSTYYAKEVILKIIGETDKLVELPNIGRIVPETNNEKIREVFVYSYRLIFKVENESINILNIIHGK